LKLPFKSLLKFIGNALIRFAIMGVVLLLFILFGNYDTQQENAAYHAVLARRAERGIWGRIGGLPSWPRQIEGTKQ
jgi:hypothetical protein